MSDFPLAPAQADGLSSAPAQADRIPLAPNTPTFSRALVRVGDSFARLSPALDLIPRLGKDLTPPDWVPWVLRNSGLERLMPFVDWKVLLDEGPAWLRIRGTPSASVTALGWLGWNVRFEDGTLGTALYDHYHIHLPDVPDRAALERIIAVERVAKSTDSRFFRLVHGYDIRPVRGGMSRYGGALFGRFSGVDIGPNLPRLSFRAHDLAIWPASTHARGAEVLTVMSWARRRDDIVYGFSRYGSRPRRGPVFALDLSDSATLLGPQARARLGESPRPVAGVVGGRTRYAWRQAVPLPWRGIAGETPRFGAYRFGQRLRPARIERIMRILDPLEFTVSAVVAPTITLSERLTERAHIMLTPQVSAAEAPDGPARIGTFVSFDTDTAPWSGLPWGDDPFGVGPRAEATEKTTTEDTTQ